MNVYRMKQLLFLTLLVLSQDLFAQKTGRAEPAYLNMNGNRNLKKYPFQKFKRIYWNQLSEHKADFYLGDKLLLDFGIPEFN